MTNELFHKIVDDGNRVANWFMLNFALLVNMIAFNIKDIQAWRVEGSDFVIDRFEGWVNEAPDSELESLCAEFGMILNGECLKPKIMHGGIEVKGTSPGKLIERNDLGPCLEFTVPYGLWDGNAIDQYGRTKYTRSTHGSLRRFFQPEWTPPSTNNEPRFSSEPLVLGYVFECLDKNGYPRPYASVVFADFPEMKKRLIQYADENGLDLTDWDRIPVGEAARNFKRGNLIFAPNSNLWYVPISIFEGLAQVTIIGEPPVFYSNGSCSAAMMKARYKSLCDHAASFVSSDQFRQSGEIEDNLPDHMAFHLMALTRAEKGGLLDSRGHIIGK